MIEKIDLLAAGGFCEGKARLNFRIRKESSDGESG